MSETVVMFLSLGILLASARILGEAAQRLKLPSLAGEILAGILLGPTFAATYFPHLIEPLFPATGNNAVILDALSKIAISLFLLVAGMEVNLSTVWRQRHAVLAVGCGSLALCFSLTFLAAWFSPAFFGHTPPADRLVFTVFLAVALSVTALPVIAKILMDLDLYRSHMGMIIVASAVFMDLIGWFIFALLLGITDPERTLSASSAALSLLSVTGFTVVMLTVVRWVVKRAIPWVSTHGSVPGALLGFALSLNLLGAALTEWMGIHAIFGSFLVGIVIGDSPHFKEELRTTLAQFISFIFAPLFFASIGLRFNFALAFDPWLILCLVGLAAAGKIGGGAIGAALSGLRLRESLALGAGMLTQGSMGIIVAMLGFKHGIGSERLLVSLVTVSTLTSIVAGPMIQAILNLKKACLLEDCFVRAMVLKRLRATTSQEAIREICREVSAVRALDADVLADAVLERENSMPTGIGHGIAIPHARVKSVKVPLVCLGISEQGIDFDAPDGQPARHVFLILSGEEDEGRQLEIFAEISRKFGDEAMRKRAMGVKAPSELIELLRTFR